LPDPALLTSLFGEAEVACRRELAAAAARNYQETGQSAMIPAYSETDPMAANFAPQAGTYDYYLNPQQGKVPTYKNEVAVLSLGELLNFDPITQAADVRVPAMVVHSNYSAFPDQAKRFLAELKGEKELVWANGNHFDYYDSPEQIDTAVQNITRYFNAHLK
jgi:fermentation-respiration switch protein FrsA (DUF1100 family)